MSIPMVDMQMIDSLTTGINEVYETQSFKPRLFSSYGITRTMFDGYDMKKALETLDSGVREKVWLNTEPSRRDLISRRDTIVHYAAGRGNLRVLKRVAPLHGSIHTADEFGRCALHYAASEGHVEVVKWLLKNSGTNQKPSETETPSYDQLSLPDIHGKTALHAAVEAKHANVVDLLVSAGADVNAYDDQGVSPFLLAHIGVARDDHDMISQYGRIVDILACAGASVNIVHHRTGWSALHGAVVLNNWRVASLLMKCGADPYCCHPERRTATPLHLAAQLGYHQTLRILLQGVPSPAIDSPSEHGWSPLQLAAVLGNLECVRTLVDKGGNLIKETPGGSTVVDLLMYKHKAKLVDFFTDMLDARVNLDDRVRNSDQIAHKIILDFKMLTPEGMPQMAVLSALMKALPREQQIIILQHPVLVVYLRLMWSRVRCIFYSSVSVHVLFVFFLSWYTILLRQADLDSSILRRTTLFSAWIPFCQSLLKFFIEPKRYCRLFENWIFTISVTIFIAVAVAGEFTPNMMMIPTSEHRDMPFKTRRPTWILHAISVAILFAWIKVMLLVGRFPAWGFYALIFSTVLKNVVKVIMIGIWVIVSFALCFSLVFHDNDQFDNPLNAFVKTVVMMTGEYNYDDLFPIENCNSTTNDCRRDHDENVFMPIASKVIFLLFILLASIVLMNLMIGLAVSDIHQLVKGGQLSRLTKQVNFVATCERMTTHRIFQSHLMPVFLTKMLKSNIRSKTILYSVTNQPAEISKKLIQDLFNIGFKNRLETKSFSNEREVCLEAMQSLLHKIAAEQELQSHRIQKFINNR